MKLTKELIKTAEEVNDQLEEIMNDPEFSKLCEKLLDIAPIKYAELHYIDDPVVFFICDDGFTTYIEVKYFLDMDLLRLDADNAHKMRVDAENRRDMEKLQLEKSERAEYKRLKQKFENL